MGKPANNKPTVEHDKVAALRAVLDYLIDVTDAARRSRDESYETSTAYIDNCFLEYGFLDLNVSGGWYQTRTTQWFRDEADFPIRAAACQELGAMMAEVLDSALEDLNCLTTDEVSPNTKTELLVKGSELIDTLSFFTQRGHLMND